MQPSEFWNLTIDEFWWWFETIIPEKLTQSAELYELLEAAEKESKNGK